MKTTNRTFAFCWRSGQIGFGRRCPAGTLPLANGPDRKIRREVRGTCRLAYDNKTLLVPGLPEAKSTRAAFKALTAYMLRLRARNLRIGTHL